jgi:hypothetical protein
LGQRLDKALARSERDMTWDAIKANKTLRNYQLMFRTALWSTAAAGLLVAIGVVVALKTPGIPMVLPFGLLMASMGGLLMYRVTVSTMHLLEQDSSRNWFSGQ